MLIHQPRTVDEEEQVSYFSPDLGPVEIFDKKAQKRMGLRRMMVQQEGLLSGGVNSGGSQSLIEQFPVRPFNVV